MREERDGGREEVGEGSGMGPGGVMNGRKERWCIKCDFVLMLTA